MKGTLTLRELNLAENQLTDECGEFCAIGISQNYSIINMSLGWNGFGPSTAKLLAEALRNNSTLLTLNLRKFLTKFFF